MADTPKDQNELTEEEATRRMDEALKRALGTPPKPHNPNETKKGGSRRQSSAKKSD